MCGRLPKQNYPRLNCNRHPSLWFWHDRNIAIINCTSLRRSLIARVSKSYHAMDRIASVAFHKHIPARTLNVLRQDHPT
jgi:hypothetical protein